MSAEHESYQILGHRTNLKIGNKNPTILGPGVLELSLNTL
jgi:hypothetical protein